MDNFTKEYKESIKDSSAFHTLIPQEYYGINKLQFNDKQHYSVNFSQATPLMDNPSHTEVYLLECKDDEIELNLKAKPELSADNLSRWFYSCYIKQDKYYLDINQVEYYINGVLISTVYGSIYDKDLQVHDVGTPLKDLRLNMNFTDIKINIRLNSCKDSLSTDLKQKIPIVVKSQLVPQDINMMLKKAINGEEIKNLDKQIVKMNGLTYFTVNHIKYNDETNKSIISKNCVGIEFKLFSKNDMEYIKIGESIVPQWLIPDSDSKKSKIYSFSSRFKINPFCYTKTGSRKITKDFEICYLDSEMKKLDYPVECILIENIAFTVHGKSAKLI